MLMGWRYWLGGLRTLLAACLVEVQVDIDLLRFISTLPGVEEAMGPSCMMDSAVAKVS